MWDKLEGLFGCPGRCWGHCGEDSAACPILRNSGSVSDVALVIKRAEIVVVAGSGTSGNNVAIVGVIYFPFCGPENNEAVPVAESKVVEPTSNRAVGGSDGLGGPSTLTDTTLKEVDVLGPIY